MPKPQAIEARDLEIAGKNLAYGCVVYVAGLPLFGIGLIGMLAAFMGGDPAGLLAATIFAMIGACSTYSGVSACWREISAGAQFVFRRASTIRGQMSLIAALAICLALWVEVPGVFMAILGFSILLWPIPLCIYANYHDVAN
jgi:hypothetical protein